MNPKPKTVVVTIESINEDGSRTVLETVPLDAEYITVNRPTSEDRLIVGQSHDEEAYDFPWGRAPSPNYGYSFDLNVRLKAAQESKYIYTITQFEAPAKNVVMVINSGAYGNTPTMCSYSEDRIAANVERNGIGNSPHYFFLDVAE